MTIDEALKITNRRVNALEYILIPRIEYIIKYIDTELQERAKEEKFKIKKVLYNKKKLKEIEEAKKQLENQVATEIPAFKDFGGDDEDANPEDEEEDLDSNLFSK